MVDEATSSSGGCQSTGGVSPGDMRAILWSAAPVTRRMSTAVVWFRRDLRLHDHPALVAALREHDEVVPLFVLDPRLIGGRFRSANRTQYLLDCLTALDGELRERGSRLVVRGGGFEGVGPALRPPARAAVL